MGEFNAGVGIVAIFIYFSLFIVVVDSVSTLDSSTYNSTAGDINYDRLSNDYVCNNPRYNFDPTTGERIEMKLNHRLLECERSNGIFDSVSCNAIYGCTWENVTTGFLWWETTTESCVGNINATAYGVDQVDPVIGRPYVAKQNSSFYGEETSWPCKADTVVFNETSCNAFSCTWEKYDIDILYNKPSSVLSVMGDVFSFRYDFGIDNTLIAWVLRLLFIIIPLILLVMSIYFIIPIIH